MERIVTRIRGQRRRPESASNTSSGDAGSCAGWAARGGNGLKSPDVGADATGDGADPCTVGADGTLGNWAPGVGVAAAIGAAAGVAATAGGRPGMPGTRTT